MEAEPPGDVDHNGDEDSQPPDTGKPASERRWQLAARRKRQGYSQEKLAEVIGVAPVTIRRWERGGSEVGSRRPLARALDVSMDRLEEILHNEDDEADEEPPEQVRPLVPEGLTVYLSMEHSASRLQGFQPHFMHGLLQTAEYARALVRGHYQGLKTPYSDAEVERLVGFRTHRRQELLTRPDDPLELDLVLGEAALHQVIGSKATMREQLEYVLLMTERSNVTVRVLSYTSGSHSAGYGPFAILTFPWEERVSVAYVNSYIGGASYLEGRHEVAFMTELFERIRELSLSPAESVKLIRRTALKEH